MIAALNAIITVALVVLVTTAQPGTYFYFFVLGLIGLWAFLGYSHLNYLIQTVAAIREGLRNYVEAEKKRMK